jgi:hypothetical protein
VIRTTLILWPMQYEREFPEEEPGGKLLDFRSEDCEEQIATIFRDDKGS